MYLSFLLLLGTLLLSPTPGETAVYYVTPTESPSECHGHQPCHTLDYYFCDQFEEYFNGTEKEVTMKLQQGRHNISCELDSSKIIKDLKTFEMIGDGFAQNTTVYLTTKLELVNMFTLHLINLTFTNAAATDYSSVSLHIYNNHSQKPTSFKPRLLSTLVMVVVNGVIFNNVSLDQSIQGLTNVSITVSDSIFMNQSKLKTQSEMTQYNDGYSRKMLVEECTFKHSYLSIQNIRTNVKIQDCTFLTSHMKVIVHYCQFTIAGNATFANGITTPITAYYSGVNLAGQISFINNTGTNGGALALYSSPLYFASNTTVSFINNNATDTGGAIYVADEAIDYKPYEYIPCFYQLIDYDNQSSWYDIKFEGNFASNGGDNIYGKSMYSCHCYVVYKGPIIPTYCVQNQYFSYHSNNSISAISSDPTRVCLCSDDGKPHCHTLERQNLEVHPGEPFSLSAVVVGADLGTTVGAIYVVLDNSSPVVVEPSTHVITDIRKCATLNFTIYSREEYEALYFTVKPQLFRNVLYFMQSAKEDTTLCKPEHRCDSHFIGHNLLHTPLLVNVSLLPCPPGFSLQGDPPACVCYTALTENNVDCQFKDGVGYQIWNSSMWVDIDADEKVYVAQNCPFGYCKINNKTANFPDNASAQCSPGRKGRLCGSCKENLSLAIGSTNCIYCPNNNNMALFIFFAAAGVMLVLFIGVFNLTVTHGTINGVTFYANLFWSYENILLPQEDANYFFKILRVLMAWLNLDFGIQACFIKGLDAYWKTWLQYFFPFYIWSIAGLIIVAAKYSSRMTKLFGNQAVSILATLFLLSYTKLLKLTIESCAYTLINIYDNNTYHYLTVWSLDGNLTYGHFPHILLVIFALSIFLFMCVPFTFGLFLMQWLRRISHFKLLKWIPRLNPVFDAYFAPLKDKHHYWFGLLLILRGVLLSILTATYTINPKINCFMLLITSSLLLCYANYHKVYKNRAVQWTENLYLILIVFIGGSGSLGDKAQHLVSYLSITVGFLGLAGIILIRNTYKIWLCLKKSEVEMEHVATEESPQASLLPGISYNSRFRDSILEETVPLINNAY